MKNDLRLRELFPDAELLNPDDITFDRHRVSHSLVGAHGQYETMRFVMRLSPRRHELIESIGEGIQRLEDVDSDVIQAYSTYIHETIHWWQHIGSTSGLLLSLSYLGQTHASLKYLSDALQKFGPHKSLKAWTDNVLRAKGDGAQADIACANVAVNNALDIEYYKRFAFDPKRHAPWLIKQQHFECVGHGYHVAYGHLISMLSAMVDPDYHFLPNIKNWEPEFARMTAQRVDGFYWGSNIYAPPLGLHAIFEGQARFCQLQYLSATHEIVPSCSQWRDRGLLEGIYVQAFDTFLEACGFAWPETVDDPTVNLFLLVCDLAMNPSAGFPLDIRDHENLIFDVDVGIRFLRLCSSIRELPSSQLVIVDQSREEYLEISNLICKQAELDSPIEAMQTISKWIDGSEAIQQLLDEYQTFRYVDTNYPLRVLLSHFFEFYRDKLERPEFFCWIGAKLVGEGLREGAADLWQKHLTLFTDRSDKPGIYPRRWPNRDKSATLEMMEKFYSGVVLYDLTRQWILEDGPFKIDVDWIFENLPDDDAAQFEWANAIFKSVYGTSLRDFHVR